MALRFAPYLLLLALAPAQCSHKPDPALRTEDTASDGLWALAEDFHAKGDDPAYRSTLRFLAARYPSGRRATQAREILDAGGAPAGSAP